MKTASNPDLVDLTIDRLDASGDGIATYRGRTIVVPFTIPGERVRVRVRPGGRGPLGGDLVEILAASPHRIVPRCAHFGPPDAPASADASAASRRSAPRQGGCGGCTWQHIAYPEQLRLKTELVDRLVRAAVPRAPETRPTISGTDATDPWGYRHKVHFVFGSTRERSGRRPAPLVMGHYARGSHRVIPVRECPVHDERGNSLAFRLRDAYTRANIAAADGYRGGVLRSVAVRVGFHTPEIMATLIVSSDADKRLRSATRRALEQHPPTALHLNLHPRGDAFVFGPETRRLSGTDRLREQVADTAFLISPIAFFQTNVRAAETLVALVLDAVPAGVPIADLYAGAGLFALPLAQRGHIVTAIEENRAAVADGEISRRLNRIPPDRCRFVASPVERAFVPGAEAIVLDPPREGCSAPVIEAVFGSPRASRAVYVSCNPEALARDLKMISRHGWEIVSMQPVDMFPHTSHVETVVVLQRLP